jgi:hypothetical protein
MVDHFQSSKQHLRAQQAKEYLISQIVEEAQKENIHLSEIERKMLYFTESQETPPDMSDINDQFEREYDSSEYEKKIANLVHNARERARRETPEKEHRWNEAIADLRNEDHYLLVMVAQASRSVRPRGDQLKLLCTALGIVAVIGGAVFLAAKYNVDLDKYAPSRDTMFFVVWAAAVGVVVLYGALWLVLGKQRMGKLIVKLVESVFTPSRRGE